MARKTKVAAAPLDANETANRVGLTASALRSRIALLKVEIMESEGKRIAALQECDRLRSEIQSLKSAAVPVTQIVGIGALSRCLGYRSSLMLQLVHDGMPHTFEDGTAVFDLPTVHRWMLDRREVRLIEAYRAEVVGIDHDTFDAVDEALDVVIEHTDAVLNGYGDGPLDGGDTAREIVRLFGVLRRLRTASNVIGRAVAS